MASLDAASQVTSTASWRHFAGFGPPAQANQPQASVAAVSIIRETMLDDSAYGSRLAQLPSCPTAMGEDFDGSTASSTTILIE